MTNYRKLTMKTFILVLCATLVALISLAMGNVAFASGVDSVEDDISTVASAGCTHSWAHSLASTLSTKDGVILKGAETLSSGKYYLNGNVSGYLKISGTVELCLNGHTLSYSALAEGEQSNDDDIDAPKDDDKGVEDRSGVPVISVESGAKFTLHDSKADDANGAVTGANHTHGGGVYVAGNGSFTMNGGAITGNYASKGDDGASPSGGGVYVSSNGSFTMNGGEISHNSTSTYGGGVYVASEATVKLNGGKISDNKSSRNGGGIYAESSFSMANVEVSANEAGYGGGVYVASGSATMTSGSISGNKATYHGGGVYVNTKGSFVFENGSISGNSANIGGAAYVNTIVRLDEPEEEIAYSATDSRESSSTSGFTMRAGSIERNTSSYGAIYVNSGAFTMAGGTITGNEIGVYLNNGSVSLSGASVIYGNVNKQQAQCNVYLASGKTVNFGELRGSAQIGVTVVSSNGKIGSGWQDSYGNAAKYVKSDVSGKCVANQSGNLVLTAHNCNVFQHDADQHYMACPNCGEKANIVTHNWSEINSYVEDANGTTHHKECPDCHEKGKSEAHVVDEYTPLGKMHYGSCKYCDAAVSGAHAANSGVVIKQPTCQATGLKEISCEACGIKMGEEVLDIVGHDYDKGVVTQKPTATQTGVLTRTCKNCNATITETLSMVDGDSSSDGDPSTGDSTGKSELLSFEYIKLLWILPALVVVCILIAILLAVFDKKKQSK